MCKKEKCPNFDKCKCKGKVGTPKEILEGVNTVISIEHSHKEDDTHYENLTFIPMTTSPHKLLNKDIVDDGSSFGMNALGVFDEDEDLLNFTNELLEELMKEEK